MQVELSKLKKGDVFLHDEGEGPEELQVVADPETKGFATRVQVKSLQDGFVFQHAGHPAALRDLMRTA